MSGTSGISICPNTMFGELNKISLGVSYISSLFGENNNCYDDSNDCYGNIFGILNGINQKVGDVSDQSGENSLFSLLQLIKIKEDFETEGFISG